VACNYTHKKSYNFFTLSYRPVVTA